MKAISPVRSVRSCYEAVCCLSEQSLAIARGGSSGGGGDGGSSKIPSPLEEPMSLLYDMNDCYSKLRELVPGIPQGSKVSQVEILQHVIDYIFDLQIVLEEQAKKKKSSSKNKGQKDSSSSNGQEAAEAALLSLQAAELASELCSKDERTHCH
ncbi:DNA-binding protein inhibitor ID-3 [Sceloporus undulatus]|uniref:DNA-binding protein inhibitor ID-3 n=1 Tax=Sceloporus undulatus TaxID=8520 RepID=UPI001C4DB26A|nr:DNA-binding protein inhibitor ID-3 [Sceloporus undulatus]